MDHLWTEPGQGFSDDWLGFRRSVDKRASGRFYAQCKYCTCVFDGRLPTLRKHKLSCAEFGAGHEVMPSDSYFESTEQEDGREEYDELEPNHEIIIKSEPRAKRPRIKGKPPKPITPKLQREYYTSPTPVISTPTQPSSQSQSQVLATPRSESRFADTARVWERKLSDLPLSQALVIEKTVNDLLYEATLAEVHRHESTTTNNTITELISPE